MRFNLTPIESLTATFAVGHWLAEKTRRQVAEVGPFQTARNLRKQGMPLALALLLVVGRE